MCKSKVKLGKTFKGGDVEKGSKIITEHFIFSDN